MVTPNKVETCEQFTVDDGYERCWPETNYLLKQSPGGCDR